MKEFMLIIRNQNDNFSSMSSEKQLKFLEACQVYIENLKKIKKLIEAQPMEREGAVVTGTAGNYREEGFKASGEVIVGYYHIFASNLTDAIAIAKANPEFVYSSTASIEVRPLKTKEDRTKFIYPTRG